MMRRQGVFSSRCFHIMLASLYLFFFIHSSTATKSSHLKLPIKYRSITQKRDLQYISDEDTTNPIQAAKDVQQLPYIANNHSGITDTTDQLVQGDSDEAQLPWNSAVPFVATPTTNISSAGGWISIPPLNGFDLNRTWQVLPGVIMPFYSLSGLDPAAIKRAVITWPGKPRDCWKYANLYRNALSVVESNQTYGVANNSVLIISPVWLNNLDQQAGSPLPNEAVFHGSQWEAGGTMRTPKFNHTLTTYDIMDNFTDMLFNKALYPALNQVVIAGHSMGGQASHRYAVLKKQKRYDDNMSFWVGNPGSWTYLSPTRPYYNSSCNATFDEWHYGLGGNMTKVTKYARKDIFANKTAVVQRYLARKVHMALGLLDNGPGDTHCEALNQGGSHLDRGSNYVLHLASVNGGSFPASQTVDFIGNTSHQDFAMMSANVSLNWLFVNDYNQRYPDINASNPGDGYRYHPPKPKSSHRTYATHGNVLLATSLMSGSLIILLLFFTILPFVFTANYTEPEQDDIHPGDTTMDSFKSYDRQSRYLDRGDKEAYKPPSAFAMYESKRRAQIIHLNDE